MLAVKEKLFYTTNNRLHKYETFVSLLRSTRRFPKGKSNPNGKAKKVCTQAINEGRKSKCSVVLLRNQEKTCYRKYCWFSFSTLNS